MPSSALAGAYGSAVTFNNAGNNFSGAFAGNGSALNNVNASTLNGLTASNFWKLMGNAGTTAGVNFLGTTDNQPLELKVNNQRALRLEPNATGPNVIGGASNNVVTPGGVEATIGGGASNVIFGPNSESTIGGGTFNRINTNRDGATIAGGVGNFIDDANASIGGGSSNRALGPVAVIGGGQSNTTAEISGATIAGGVLNFVGAQNGTVGGGLLNFLDGAEGGTIGGGENNFVRDVGGTIAGGFSNFVGPNASVGGGVSNRAEVVLSTIPGGLQAKAFHYGQLAHASGMFSDFGDAQTSEFLSRNTTSNATPTELFLDGQSRRLFVTNNTTWTFHIFVSAQCTVGNSAGFEMRGVIKNHLGTVTFVGTPIVTVLGRDIAAWNATVVADDTNNALVILVTGTTGANVRWVATTRTTEVSLLQ